MTIPRWHEKSVPLGIFTAILSLLVTVFIFLITFTFARAKEADSNVVMLRETLDIRLTGIETKLYSMQADLQTLKAQQVSSVKSLDTISQKLNLIITP